MLGTDGRLPYATGVSLEEWLQNYGDVIAGLKNLCQQLNDF